MAEQQYRRPSSPARANRGYSDASTSLSPLGGLAPGSALGQSSDLLGLPGSTPMPFDYPSVPRNYSSPHDFPARESNNPYGPGIFLDGNSDQRQLPSDTSALPFSPNYSLQPGDASITATCAAPWSALQIASPIRPSRETVHAQQKQRQLVGQNNRFPPGPGSDRVSRTNASDEGYYSHSQPDAQSVHSMSTWNLTQDRQNMQRRQLAVTPPYSQSGPGNTSFPRPDSDVQDEQINAGHTVESQQMLNSLECTHEECTHKSRTLSEFKKHAARHNKEHVCRQLGCSRTEGFATINDLERHQKSVHKIQPQHGLSKEYKCFGASCPKHDKVWPRYDNFKQHLKRMHPNEDLEMLIRQSIEWYEQYVKPQPKREGRPPQRPSTSSSLQVTTQNTAQTRIHLSSPGQFSQRRPTNHSRDGIAPGPSYQRLGTSYPRSEVGYHSTSLSGSNTSLSMSRSTFGEMPSPSSFPSGPIPGCSRSFRTSDMVREHVQLHHGPQNTSTPTQIWNMNQNNQRHRSAFLPGHFVPSQTLAGNMTRVQSLDQPQMRAASMAYSRRTVPGSIPPQQNRLEEDFENTPMTHSQDALLATEGSDMILAQIGMMDEFLPSASHDNNLGPGTSQGQVIDQREDRQTMQVPLDSTEAITSFLKDHASKVSNDRIISAIHMTVESLQSTSSNGDISITPATTSALDTDNFPPATRDGKSGFLCSYPRCPKFQRRKCELKKHYKRHTLPWACTFDMCRKPCGSKNDWKRHESRLHQQQECWRCEEKQSNNSGRSVPDAGHDACKRLFSTKELYVKHLDDQHKIREAVLLANLCRTQRIGLRCQGQYWCGFCNRIISMKAIGIEGDSERYNHIDHHFTKEKKKIAEWKLLNGRPVPGDLAMDTAHNSSVENSSSGSSPEDEGADPATDANVHQSTAAQNGFGKRPASTSAAGAHGRATKIARSVSSRPHIVWTQMVTCCQCVNMFQSWNPACTSCNHHRCDNCSARMFDQTEPDQ